MKRPTLFLILVMITVLATGQQSDTLNLTDSQGRKQGHWVKKYPDGTVQYDGYFKDDKPVGQFRRYYESGSLKSMIFYEENSREVRARFYHPNGFAAAEGMYLDQYKEGKWVFFSEKTEGYLICEEYYHADKRNGISVKYYKDGKTAEKIIFTDDIRSGEWTQYYVTGKLCLKGYYSRGKLNGSFEVYYANGNPEYIGQYKDDVRDGLWKIYKEDGNVDIELTYNMGRLNDPRIAERENAFLDFLEKNRGRLSDPEITGTIWK